MSRNEQECLWSDRFRNAYASRNVGFNPRLEEEAWTKMTACLPKTSWTTVVECGCNTGRNLLTLRRLRPELDLSLIELNTASYEAAVKSIQPYHSFNGSIMESNLPVNVFDLVFTCGVLIHIHPDDLFANCPKIVEYSRRYVLIAEYFNRTPVGIDYRGRKNKLFKRDFGSFMLEHFKIRCVDYGFLWGRIYDAGGFDDVTWWVFEKRV